MQMAVGGSRLGAAAAVRYVGVDRGSALRFCKRHAHTATQHEANDELGNQTYGFFEPGAQIASIQKQRSDVRRLLLLLRPCKTRRGVRLRSSRSEASCPTWIFRRTCKPRSLIFTCFSDRLSGPQSSSVPHAASCAARFGVVGPFEVFEVSSDATQSLFVARCPQDASRDGRSNGCQSVRRQRKRVRP